MICLTSYCSIFALKPTWNRISRDGIKMYSATLDTLGWFAQSVDDLARVYAALVPEAPALPRRDLRGARIARAIHAALPTL